MMWRWPACCSCSSICSSLDRERTPALLIPIGLARGFRLRDEVHRGFGGALRAGFVAWKLIRKREKMLPPLAVLAACALVMIVPGWPKNWIQIGNPCPPFFNKYFRSLRTHQLRAARVPREPGPLERRVTDWRDIPVEATFAARKAARRARPVFLLAPLALLPCGGGGRQLLLAAAGLTGSPIGNIGTRFLIPCLPFLALAMGLAMENWRGDLPRWCSSSSHCWPTF